MIFVCISRYNKIGHFLWFFILMSVELKGWFIWDKVFKNGPRKICGRQPLRNLKGYDLLKQRSFSTTFPWSILEYFVPYISWYNCAKFYCYLICVTDFRLGAPHLRPLVAPKRLILYKFKRICQNHNKSKEIRSKTFSQKV